MLKLLFQISSELFLILFYPIFSLTLQFEQKPSKTTKNTQGVVVMVERWLSLNLRHVYWKRYLEKRGYKVYLVNFPFWHKDFTESSDALSKFMEKNEIKKATLIGISSGAVTCLLYLQELNGWERIDRFISIGAPFKGTWLMLFLSFIESGRELLPGSSLTKKIANFTVKDPERTYCIKAKFDEMVPSGSILNGVHKVVINVYGHNNLHLMHKNTYAYIARKI